MTKSTALTKEYFEGYLDKRLKDLRVSMTKELKEHVSKEINYATKEIADLAGMTARGFRDVHEKIDALDEKVDRIKLNATERIVDHENRIRHAEHMLGVV